MSIESDQYQNRLECSYVANSTLSAPAVIEGLQAVALALGAARGNHHQSLCSKLPPPK
jgi:hypothetical protein